MTQKSVLLAMLKESGSRGVSAHTLIYRHGITRAASIVHELREEGHNIETRDDGETPEGKRKLATYILRTPIMHRPQSVMSRQSGPGFFDEPAATKAVAKAITFECGCVREAGARFWEKRCEKHTPTAP